MGARKDILDELNFKTKYATKSCAMLLDTAPATLNPMMLNRLPDMRYSTPMPSALARAPGRLKINMGNVPNMPASKHLKSATPAAALIPYNTRAMMVAMFANPSLSHKEALARFLRENGELLTLLGGKVGAFLWVEHSL